MRLIQTLKRKKKEIKEKTKIKTINQTQYLIKKPKPEKIVSLEIKIK